jgi:hypothetical protein
MAGKLAAPLTAGNDAGVLRGVYASAACAGLLVAPSAIEGADAIGGARTPRTGTRARGARAADIPRLVQWRACACSLM